ncbi:MAG: DNA-processing protein DprA [Burkholderiales bacterium]|uniref:DNA-processing protein DprA n=1 Tax=Inhella sp. TaxID=1921806 RepID=UPI001AD5796B|nr:DNA-processing protein DprA [Burkholderiales bacterium]
MDELAAWLRLLGAPGVGRVAARKLIQRLGSLQAAAAAQPSTAELDARIEHSRRWLQGSPLRSILVLGDADYPSALLNSPDPPLLLFLEGQREQLGRLPALAVVGSRHPTPQGRETAHGLAAELAAAGYAVVSGLAIGIDGAAHSGALSIGPHGASWAVLGSGLDLIHPRSHRELAERLVAQGLLISEHPPGTAALPQHFPVRNRIIAGLSQGCLVVEAAEQSGSLITARLAAEAGREVFAVPGSIRSPQSRGCHQLIQQGAKLVQQLTDLLPELPPAPATPVTAESPSPSDPLLDALGWEPSTLEQLQARCGMSTEVLLTRLLDLELEGKVRRVNGGRFERCASA